MFLQENKSEQYNECIREFIEQKFYKRLFVSNPSTYFSVTLTLKQTLNDMRLDEINFSQDFRYFMNRLNTLLYKNSFKRYGKRVEVIPFLEGLVGKRPHYHVLMKKPKNVNYLKFRMMICELWKKTRFGYNDIKFNEKTDNGWGGYSTKEITCNTDNVDWESFYRVC